LRDCGSPTDTRSLDDHDDLPRIIRAGKHLARPKRYEAGFSVELEDESQLPAAVAEQARRGDGWIKLVGDWIDRSVGDLAPLWSDDVLKAAIDAAHGHGARVTAHVFSGDAMPGLINAGIDCIEHGTGLSDDVIALMVRHGTVLVPTLVNVIENFPDIADAAKRYPTYAAHMRDLHARALPRIAAAREAGVPIYAGSDAGTMIAHGRIADEVDALKGIGMSPTEALGAACWDARRWLGRTGLDQGASADLLCYSQDPRQGPGVLNHPDLVILRGKTFRPASRP
jgi:imidazolonepropionase-like amidohydrolase